MPYVAIKEPGHPLKGEKTMQICFQDANHRLVPALNLIVKDKEFPIDHEVLLQNLATLLNGKDSVQSTPLAKDWSLHYTRMHSALDVRARKESGGVSECRLLLAVHGREDSERQPGYEALAKINSGLMAALCGAVSPQVPGQKYDSRPLPHP